MENGLGACDGVKEDLSGEGETDSRDQRHLETPMTQKYCRKRIRIGMKTSRGRLKKEMET